MKLQEIIYFILNKLKESGIDKLSVDSNGYLKIDTGIIADSYNGRTLDLNTNNTSDTWVPVIHSNKIEHRVIPSNANSNCTKYGNIWTDGNIVLKRRGNIVQVDGDPVLLSEVSERTTFAMIPEGFRPVDTAYVQINTIGEYLLFNRNGTVQCNPYKFVGRIWFSGTWAVD